MKHATQSLVITTTINKLECKEELKVKWTHQYKELSAFVFCTWGIFVLVKEFCLNWRDEVEDWGFLRHGTLSRQELHALY